jgi:hypothetical protein
MVPLRLGLVEGGQDVELSSRHCVKLSSSSPALPALTPATATPLWFLQ